MGPNRGTPEGRRAARIRHATASMRHVTQGTIAAAFLL
jgi:hypothetical protein